MDMDPISNSNTVNSTPYYPEYYTPEFWQQELYSLGTQIHRSDDQWKESQTNMQAIYTDTLD